MAIETFDVELDTCLGGREPLGQQGGSFWLKSDVYEGQVENGLNCV